MCLGINLKTLYTNIKTNKIITIDFTNWLYKFAIPESIIKQIINNNTENFVHTIIIMTACDKIRLLYEYIIDILKLENKMRLETFT